MISGRASVSNMRVLSRGSRAAIAVLIIFTLAGSAAAQDDRSPNFLDNLFGGNRAPPPAARSAGPDEAELTVQINQLQQQLRQLTGTIEQLQYRNQQLEQQVRALGGGAPAPGAVAGQTPALTPRTGMPAPPATGYPPQANTDPSTVGNYPSAANTYPPAVPAAPGGRRSDVFDPSQNPNAPGAPRALGSPDSASQPPIGAPGGRAAGAPLDLSTPGTDPYADGMLPSGRDAGPGAQIASVAPSATPRDEFDLAFGYVQRKDYALAEDSLRTFLKKYPSDARVADAQYWLGESLYQRQRYRDAAESFLAVTTKFDRSQKAPDALMRLGQSLAALGEKETACAAWGEIGRKYSNASTNVKKNVAAEQKRVRC